ncbi:MAG TPA: SCO family protein [Methylomirabilota bacterium]
MSETGRARLAVGALAAIVAVTASWWALALWPAAPGTPEWLLRTRDVCFGTTDDGLPSGGGWILLIGQPIGMLGLLATVWGAELRAGLRRMTAGLAGQLAVGVVLAFVTLGLWASAERVRSAGSEAFAPGDVTAAQLTRVNDRAPALALTDQAGRQVSLDAFRGRAVLVAFAYAHCDTVCPVIVSDVLAARRELREDPPAVLVVTLDPWRDTPGRLPAIAEQWDVNGDAHVLSGPPELVERTLNAWRVPRVRNGRTGEISHPSMVYVVGADGRIAYVVNGGASAISAAVRGL